MTTQTGYSICSICDIGCQVRTESEDGRVTRVIAHDNPLLAKNICFKGVAAPRIHNAPDRLRVPLKRVGERGENRWQEISYEQALDEIAERLRKWSMTMGQRAWRCRRRGGTLKRRKLQTDAL